jgi:hypothetical protein
MQTKDDQPDTVPPTGEELLAAKRAAVDAVRQAMQEAGGDQEKAIEILFARCDSDPRVRLGMAGMAVDYLLHVRREMDK